MQKNMKKTLLLSMAAAFAVANIANAQEDSTKTVAESKGALDFSGYVDTYYQYNLNRPINGLSQGRIFDLYHNNFSLGLVQTMLTYSKDKVTVVADLTFGPNADLGNFGNAGTARFIKQAYLSYNFTDMLKFTIGQYGTHIGYELIDAPLNFNYSLSYLFGNGPFYHTGVKLDYNISDKIGMMIGLVNGWDGMQDFNASKSVTAQFRLSPVEGFDIYTNWIGGDECNTMSNFGTTTGSFTSLYDLTTAYQLTEAFKIGINAAYGTFRTGALEASDEDPWSKDAIWKGAALYLNYAANDKVGVGLRGEYFSDPGGVRYLGPLEVTGITLTGDLKLAKGKLNIKPELRYDITKDNFFIARSDMATQKAQTTMGIAFIYMFNASILK
jgi:hypothetical protein